MASFANRNLKIWFDFFKLILDEQTQYDNQRRQQAAAAAQQQQQPRATFLVRPNATGTQAQQAQYYFTQVRMQTLFQ